jgi:hypothetical protein
MKQKRVDDRLKKAVRKKRKKQTVVTGGGTNVSVQTTQNVTNITEANFLESLQDVSILYPAEGDGIFYDSVTGKWTNEQPTGGPGATALDDLTDVTITTPSDGDVLTYDSGEWVNAAPTGGALDLEQVLTEGNDGGALQIKNIADPTDPQDAATKAYVDNTLPAPNTGGYLFLYYNFY